MPERLHVSVAMMADGAGAFCRYQFFACGPWVWPGQPGAPTAPVDKWLVAQATADGAQIPEIMKFDGKRFRSPTGAQKSIPWRWAELVLVEPVTESQPGPVAPLYPMELGKALIDLAMKNFQRGKVLQWADESQWNNPDEGAPEL